MAGNAADLKIWQGGCTTIEVECFVEGDAKLVALQAGGDVRVGLGVDVRIHPQGDRCEHAELRCNVVEPVEFGCRLDVEATDAGFECLAHLCACLADTGEHHLGRIATGGDDAGKLSTGDDVETGAQCGKHRQHAEVGVRLDGVAHQRRTSLQGIAIGFEGANQCSA